jgi:kynurenine formamidase
MISLKAQSYSLLDLTHPLNPAAPTWSGTCGFEQRIIVDYPEACRVQEITMNAGTGTHIDAPLHFIPGAKSVADIAIEELIVPLCVVNVSKKVHADYYITAQDITEYEQHHGEIEADSFVIGHTGWDQRWHNPQLYRNPDPTGQMHFPGFTAEAAELLLARKIKGIGIDSLSPDCLDLKFPVHYLILGAGKYIIENLTQCQKLPPKGAFGIFLPIKTTGGTEGVMRAVALIPCPSI